MLSCMISILKTGDKRGFFGILDVDSDDSNACVTLFRPHVRPLTSILIDPNNTHKVGGWRYVGEVDSGEFDRAMQASACPVW